MNTRAFLFLILLIHANQVFTQNWVTVNPLPQNDFYAINFFNDQTGIVAGKDGAIYKTFDAGTSWQSIISGTNKSINSFYFTNLTNGFAVGDSGLILHTSNSGSDWITKTSNTLSKINSMSNSPSGILLSACNNGVLLRSNDGGNLWSAQVVSGFNLNYIFVVDDNNWYACGDSDLVLKTTNSGINWFRYKIINNGYNYSFVSLHFFDLNTGYALSTFRLYKTTNGGINWSEGLLMGQSFRKMKFISGQLGYTIGINSPVSKTTNSGANWITQGPGNSYYDRFNDICVMDSNKIFMCGDGGVIVKSTNSGSHLLHIGGLVASYSNFSFYDANSGVVNSSNYILRTTSGGNSWQIDADGMNNWFEPTIISFSKVKFNTYSNGYRITNYSGAFSPSASVSLSTDGGATWGGPSIGGTYSQVSDIEAIGNSGIASGKILSTSTQIYRTNNGSPWVTQYTSSINHAMIKISFSNLSTGIVVGYMSNNVTQNFVIRTTNSGLNWVESLLPQTNKVKTASMLADGNGFVLCDSGMILKTTNFGENWATLLGNNSYSFKTFSFLDVNHGYAISGNNKFAFSSNGGTIWSLHDLPENSSFSAIQFLNPNTGYIGGSNTLLKTTDGGLTFINSSNSNIPDRFLLSQNYPNPFNPVTNIRFDIPVGNGRDRSVKLIIYDLLGREVIKLVDKQLQPGEYSVDWDASNYPSGVYFYSLLNGELSITKKMVLIK